MGVMLQNDKGTRAEGLGELRQYPFPNTNDRSLSEIASLRKGERLVDKIGFDDGPSSQGGRDEHP